MRTFIASLVSLFLLCLLTSCGGSYVDPRTGVSEKWESPDPDDMTPEQKKDAYEKLEQKLADNQSALIEALASRNTEMKDRALANTREITEAKSKLGYKPSPSGG